MTKKAKEKASKIVDDAKKEAEEVISELRKMQSKCTYVVKEHEIIEAKKRLEEAAPVKIVY